MKFAVIGIALSVATGFAMFLLLLAGNVEAAGISLAFGMMLSYIPRLLAEIKGGDR